MSVSEEQLISCRQVTCLVHVITECLSDWRVTFAGVGARLQSASVRLLHLTASHCEVDV